MSLSLSESIPVSHEIIRILEQKSILHRRVLLKMIYTAKAGHTGGSLSCVDILNVLYNHVMNISPENFSELNRDHYIHSKGHSVEALYAVLADKGFFPFNALDSVETYGQCHPHSKRKSMSKSAGILFDARHVAGWVTNKI